MKNKLLCLCDSPTMESGFGRVAQNLLRRWQAAGAFSEIWVWGIGYRGFPHEIDFLQNRIFPSTTENAPLWYDKRNLNRFLALLEGETLLGSEGGITHVWIMQDTFALYSIAKELRAVCAKRGIRSLLYFPVDAPLDPRWTDILAAVDVPVAYCEYGRAVAEKALRAPVGDPWDSVRRNTVKRLNVLPHGVDASVYRPIPMEENNVVEVRRKMFQGVVTPTDFLMVNVNRNQRRKGLAQTLVLLKRMQERHPEMRAKLYMHMPEENSGDGVSLVSVAEQLGLVVNEDLFFGDGMFRNGHALIREEQLNVLYNIADLLVTTPYGEGWGLPLTEAMAAGAPVAGPRHTSVEEILGNAECGLRNAESSIASTGLNRGILFNLLGEDVAPGDNSRLRPRTDVDDAVMKIHAAWAAHPTELGSLWSISQRGREWVKWLNWDRIAEEWLRLFEVS